MDNFLFEGSTINITDGIIENISMDNNSTLVTVSYQTCVNCNRRNETVRLVVTNRTLIIDEFGNNIPASELRTGMTINATFSTAMTRSIPPQSNAFFIHVTGRRLPDSNTVGRIIDIDRNFRNFTTISDSNLSSVIRFNVPTNARIYGPNGRPINFSRLMPGMRVQVRHASFMTASIPPQTTAFEVRVR